MPQQVSAAIKGALRTMKRVTFYRACGFTANTMVRALSGEGMRIDTLLKIASVLGWTVEVRDRDGTILAQHQGAKEAPAEPAE